MIDKVTRSQKPRRLSELTWEEARAYVQLVEPIVLLPVGATEAHGPHLPLGTDVLLSEELAFRAQLALEEAGHIVFIAPSLAYAVTEFGAAFPGTVSVSPQTATALYTDVCAGLQRGGFRKVCLINSHLEPAHIAALRAACAAVLAATGHKVAFPDHTERRFARTLSDEYRRGNCHAGRYETSLLLDTRPDLVREELRTALPRNDGDLLGAMQRGVTSFAEAGGPRAYFGDPQEATAEEGDELYRRLTEMVVTVVKETWG
jgi:creatinine amidohydrolase